MKTQAQLSAMFLDLAAVAFAGIGPFDKASSYTNWSYNTLPEEERNWRVTRWLRGTESTIQLNNEELCLFLLFIREAASA